MAGFFPAIHFPESVGALRIALRFIIHRFWKMDHRHEAGDDDLRERCVAAISSFAV
jgi:hypothetical protein